MTSFDEILKTLQDEINSLATSQKSEEELSKIASMNQTLANLQEQHKALKEENTRLKDKIVDSIKFSGSSKQYDDVQPKQSMSFEEYAQSYKPKLN